MLWIQQLFVALVVATVALVLLLVVRPSITAQRGGKVIAFVAFLALPILVTNLGVEAHLERSKSTEFCLSCHVMEPYGKSLWRADQDYLPAAHFQNNRVSRDEACYSCHTQYTMFGDLQSKLKGIRHVWVYYLGTVPEEIELYEPFSNRECLHCHGGARSFVEGELHVDMLVELEAGETPCTECHDLAHDVADVEGAEMWEGSRNE